MHIDLFKRRFLIFKCFYFNFVGQGNTNNVLFIFIIFLWALMRNETVLKYCFLIPYFYDYVSNIIRERNF
jgi:hypothetical protein